MMFGLGRPNVEKMKGVERLIKVLNDNDIIVYRTAIIALASV